MVNRIFLHGLQPAGDQHIGKIEGIEMDHVGGLKDLKKTFLNILGRSNKFRCIWFWLLNLFLSGEAVFASHCER